MVATKSKSSSSSSPSATIKAAHVGKGSKRKKELSLTHNVINAKEEAIASAVLEVAAAAATNNTVVRMDDGSGDDPTTTATATVVPTCLQTKLFSFDEKNNDVGAPATTSEPWYNIVTKGDPEYNDYMANEWGFEKRGDDVLFEALSLQGMLRDGDVSWLTILHNRDAYRRIFYDFHIEKVATMHYEDVQRILVQHAEEVINDEGSLLSIIANAMAIQHLRTWAGNDNSFDNIAWNCVQHKPILNISRRYHRSRGQPTSPGTTTNRESDDPVVDEPPQPLPSETAESMQMSRQLQTLGFSYVTPKICYSTMQCIGMVIDHPADCPEWNAAQQRLQIRPNGYQTR